MTIWADYSGRPPGGAALRAAGFTGVLRYCGRPGLVKNITAAEYQDLINHGLGVLLVYEHFTADVTGGHPAGVANAQAALADARACGIPDTVGIAAASDEHLTAAQVREGLDYLTGFASVLGLARTGAYGFGEYIDAVKAAGKASWFWQAGHAPAANSGVHFWQRNAGQTTITLNGTTCDIDDQLLPIGDNDVSYDDAYNAVRNFFNNELYQSQVPGSTVRIPLSAAIMGTDRVLWQQLPSRVRGSKVTDTLGGFVQNADMYGFELSQVIGAIQQDIANLTETVKNLSSAVAALSGPGSGVQLNKEQLLAAIGQAIENSAHS